MYNEQPSCFVLIAVGHLCSKTAHRSSTSGSQRPLSTCQHTQSTVTRSFVFAMGEYFGDVPLDLGGYQRTGSFSFKPYHALLLIGMRSRADDPKENIMCVLHECFDYIDEARTNGGKVYVHCSQGVSRSATIAIGYCIWKLNKDFDIIFEYVKKIRTVVSPNMGFQCVSPLYSVL